MLTRLDRSDNRELRDDAMITGAGFGLMTVAPIEITGGLGAGRNTVSSNATKAPITGLGGIEESGKKDSRALAATEKANVCTTMRNRYFTDPKIAPEREKRLARYGRGGFGLSGNPGWAVNSSPIL